jgi:DNA repair protein RadC
MTDLVTVTFKLIRELALHSSGEIADFLIREGFTDDAQECLWIIPTDNANHIRAVVEVARGGYHDLPISIPTILSPVLLAASDRFVVAHNHPSGNTDPTEKDVSLTINIMRAAAVLRLDFEDHLIIGPPNHWTSLRERGVWPRKESA